MDSFDKLIREIEPKEQTDLNAYEAISGSEHDRELSGMTFHVRVKAHPAELDLIEERAQEVFKLHDRQPNETMSKKYTYEMQMAAEFCRVETADNEGVKRARPTKEWDLIFTRYPKLRTEIQMRLWKLTPLYASILEKTDPNYDQEVKKLGEDSARQAATETVPASINGDSSTKNLSTSETPITNLSEMKADN